MKFLPDSYAAGMASPMRADPGFEIEWGDDAELAFRHEQGTVIRTLMRLTGVTGRQIADALGLNESAVSNRLSGATAFRAPELVVVARLLGVDPGVLYRSAADVLEKIASNRCYAGFAPSTDAVWAVREGWGDRDHWGTAITLESERGRQLAGIIPPP